MLPGILRIGTATPFLVQRVVGSESLLDCIFGLSLLLFRGQPNAWETHEEWERERTNPTACCFGDL